MFNKTIKQPKGVSATGKGLVAVTVKNKHCVLIFDKEEKIVRQVSCSGCGKNPGELTDPADVYNISERW